VCFLIIAAFIIIAPYIGAQGRYDYVFDSQPRVVKIPWFALFQVVSAFSNTGMSLVDLSMIPFQRAYLMIYGGLIVLAVVLTVSHDVLDLCWKYCLCE
jgi:Trk-type K+ transport system membrane component